MKIAVLIKQVPASGNVAVDPITHCLIRKNMEMIVNPADLHAITAAILIRQQSGGRITAFSMGPPEAESVLRTAVAMGVDEAFLLSDRCFGGGDTLGTAKVLSAALTYCGGFDVVLAGSASADSATGQVGPMVAQLLGIPSIVDARDVTLTEGSFSVLRHGLDREILLRAVPPCLITMEPGSNQIILPTLRAQVKANHLPITVLSNEQLALDSSKIGKRGAKSLVMDTIIRADIHRQARMLEGTPQDMARRIWALLGEESL